MKLKHNKNGGFTLVELLVVIAIIAGLAAISSPIIIRQLARSRATTALNNGKDIHKAIQSYAFDNAGQTPDQAAGTDSNAAFRVLFATGHCQDEKPFYVDGTATVAGAVEGDGNFVGNAALAAGENVWSYYQAGAVRTNITTDAANTPLIGIPNISNGNIYQGTFELAAFGGQAVIVRTDGSAVTYGLTPAAANGIEAGTCIDEAGQALTAVSGGDDFSLHVPTLAIGGGGDDTTTN